MHGIPKKIISDRDGKFTLKFWKVLFVGFGRELVFSTMYHPQIYGPTEIVNKVSEYMLRMYSMH